MSIKPTFQREKLNASGTKISLYIFSQFSLSRRKRKFAFHLLLTLANCLNTFRAGKFFIYGAIFLMANFFTLSSEIETSRSERAKRV